MFAQHTHCVDRTVCVVVNERENRLKLLNFGKIIKFIKFTYLFFWKELSSLKRCSVANVVDAQTQSSRSILASPTPK